MFRLTIATALVLFVSNQAQAHDQATHTEPLVVPAVHTVLDELSTYVEPVHYRSYRHRRHRYGYHRHGRGYYRYGHRHSYRSPYHRHNRRGYYNYRRYY